MPDLTQKLTMLAELIGDKQVVAGLQQLTEAQGGSDAASQFRRMVNGESAARDAEQFG
ncbi:MAG: hypothetical protein Q7R41_18780 [Phycisphaerales bacterium]|nr:hypothetical protein [Phycisphaerales bacterium]